DDDERAEAHLVEHLDDAIGVHVLAFGRLDRAVERVARVLRAQDGAAQAQNAGDVAGRQRARSIVLEETVETVLEADALDAARGARLHDGPDDRIETGRVAAAGQNADSRRCWHADRI